MDSIIETLFDALEPERQSPAERAAVKAAEAAILRVEAKLTTEEFSALWNAALDVGLADQRDSFARGLRLGMRLVLEGVIL